MAWSCRSHSPPWSQIGQSSGWLISRNSITPSRAFFTIGERVEISGGSPLGPGRQSRTPQAQLATRFGPPLYLPQPHPAIAGDRQPLMVAEARNFRARDLAGLQQRELRRNIDLFAIDDEFGHCSLSLSQLAVGWCDAGGFQGRLYPLLGVGAVGREISWLGLVLLAQERQVRLQVVIAGGLPFAFVGKCRHRLFAGVQEVRDEAFILNLRVAAGGLDDPVVRRRESGILERQIGIAQK